MSNTRRRRKPGSAARARAAVGADRLFTFAHNGRTYTLPPASGAVAKMKAGDLIDAVMDDSELAELRIGLSALQSADVDPAAMEALRDKPMPEFSQVLEKWMRATGANPGESPRSST